MKTHFRGFLPGFITTLLLFTLVFSVGSASASSIKGIDITINGDLLNIPPSFGAPFYDESNRLQIPMRYIIQSCGYDVVWNNTEQSATIPTKNGDIKISLGSTTMYSPTGNVAMDTCATVKDSRTYIPLRFALEALGFQVKWSSGSVADTIAITGNIGDTSSRNVLTATEVSAIASPATFYIEVEDVNNTVLGSGSGFFIDPSGIGVTNYHVIEGASFANITMTSGAKHRIGSILYYDIARDIAIFKIASNTVGEHLNVPYLSIAVPSSIQNGDVAYAIGSPLGLQNSITDGLVSNHNRILPGEKAYPYIQTSAPISHGNSGGPLLNWHGEVIGINSASLTDAQNLNLAIPMSAINKISLTSDHILSLQEIAEKEGVITPPKNLRIISQTGDAVQIQWDPVSGADSYHFYYQKDGDEFFWFDGENDIPTSLYWNDGYSCDYSGLQNGETYHVIVTAVKGGIESMDSKILTFSFTGTGKPTTGKTTYYSDVPWLPDFGAIYGYAPTKHRTTGQFTEYHYSALGSDRNSYYDLLEGLGLVFDEKVSQELSDIFHIPIAYVNLSNYAIVVVDIDRITSDFVIVAYTPPSGSPTTPPPYNSSAYDAELSSLDMAYASAKKDIESRYAAALSYKKQTEENMAKFAPNGIISESSQLAINNSYRNEVDAIRRAEDALDRTYNSDVSALNAKYGK